MQSEKPFQGAIAPCPALEIVLLAVSTSQCWLTFALVPPQSKAWMRWAAQLPDPLVLSQKSKQMLPLRICTPTPPGAGAVFQAGALLHGPSTRQPCPADAQPGPPIATHWPGLAFSSSLAAVAVGAAAKASGASAAGQSVSATVSPPAMAWPIVDAVVADISIRASIVDRHR